MKRIPGIKPLYVEKDGTLWASRGLYLLRSDDLGESFQFVGKHSGGFAQRVSRMCRLAERFTRSGFQALVPLSDGSYLAVIRGHILKLDAGAKTFRKVFRVPRGSRPLNVCRFPDGRLSWGEYFFNREKEEVYIYASEDGGESWNVAYTFPAGEVRHIHGIYYDASRNGVWILTGDSDEESKILFTRGGFDDLETVFGGSQDFRSTFVIPMRDGLLIGGDSPFQKNYIQLLDPESGRAEKVQPVSGSAFYACSVGGWAVVSVAAEPSKVNTCPYASLWVSRNGRDWRELYRARRDVWQMPYNSLIPDHIAELPLLQHAAFVLPTGECERPVLFAYGQAVREDDGCTLCWDLENQCDASGVPERDGDRCGSERG